MNSLAAKRPILFLIIFFSGLVINLIFLAFAISGILFSDFISEYFEELSPGHGNVAGNLVLIISLLFFMIFGFKITGITLLYYKKKAGVLVYLIPTGVLMVINVVIIVATYNIYLIFAFFLSILFLVLFVKLYKR